MSKAFHSIFINRTFSKSTNLYTFFTKPQMKLHTKIEGKEYEAKVNETLIGVLAYPPYHYEGYSYEVEFQEVKKPSYSRQEVLSELWIPSEVEFSIYEGEDGKHEIVEHDSCGCQLKDFYSHIPKHSFAPTRELAEEIVQIRLGKWEPKIGDFIWGCKWDCSIGIYEFAGQKLPYNWSGSNSARAFPSVAQRQTFIEKNKPKEEPGKSEYLSLVAELESIAKKLKANKYANDNSIDINLTISKRSSKWFNGGYTR